MSMNFETPEGRSMNFEMPEVGDIVVVPRPTDEQIEQEADDDGTIEVNVEHLEIVEVREPGFYVVKPPGWGEPGALEYSQMMGAELKVTVRYTPTKPRYEADAWIQVEGGLPERMRIARLYKRHEVSETKRVRVRLHVPKEKSNE